MIHCAKNFLKIMKSSQKLIGNFKRLVREGVNPSNIVKSIQRDDIEKIQEVSSQNNFDFNQKIESSL